MATFRNLTPDLNATPGYERLTVGALRRALDGIDADVPVDSGYYTCHGVTLIIKDDGAIVLNIDNSE